MKNDRTFSFLETEGEYCLSFTDNDIFFTAKSTGSALGRAQVQPLKDFTVCAQGRAVAKL
jgi:hypothetical protein